MFILQQPVELGPLVIVQQAHADAFQEIRFLANRGENHANTLASGRAEVQSFCMSPHPCLHSVPVRESAVGE